MAGLPDELQHACRINCSMLACCILQSKEKIAVWQDFLCRNIEEIVFFLSHGLHGGIDDNEHDDKELHEEGE